MSPGHRQQLARLAAPVAILLAATVLVLLVRSALNAESTATSTTTAPVTTAQPVETAEQPPPGTAAPPATTAPATTQAGATYTIQQGDTLESVASQYGTTVEELLELNPGVDPVNLTIGQRIRVP